MPARQTCPALRYISAPVAAAASRSASSSTMNGLLPPSSRLQGTRLAPAACAIHFAVGTLPVNEMRARRGSLTSLAPVLAPLPCTTLNTPGGRPAASAASASSEQVSGAHSGGFSTQVLPAASAGPSFQVDSISGAFHGVMMATTPAGSWRTRWRACAVSSGRSCSVSACSANQLMLSIARGTTPCRMRDSSTPASLLSSTQKASARWPISAAKRSRYGLRPAAPSAAQAGKARCAALMAASTADCPPSAMRPSGRWSIGLKSSKVSADATRRPSM